MNNMDIETQEYIERLEAENRKLSCIIVTNEIIIRNLEREIAVRDPWYYKRLGPDKWPVPIGEC